MLLNTDKHLWYLHVKVLKMLEVTASGAAPSDTGTEEEKMSGGVIICSTIWQV